MAQKLDRFRCGDDDIVLERPRAIERDALDQDSITHQAFDMAWENYADALTINTHAFVSFAYPLKKRDPRSPGGGEFPHFRYPETSV